MKYTIEIFDDLKFGDFEDNVSQLNTKCMQQLLDYKIYFSRVGLLNIKYLLGQGLVTLLRDKKGDDLIPFETSVYTG